MDALQLLKADHEKVKKLLNQADASTERAEKKRTELFSAIKQELTVHEQVEEEIFYPALRNHPKAREIVLEAYEEHNVVDTILSDLERTDVTDETWAAKFTVMKENLEHHIEEEEGEMFEQARRVFDSEELRTLGERMAQMKEQRAGS